MLLSFFVDKSVQCLCISFGLIGFIFQSFYKLQLIQNISRQITVGYLTILSFILAPYLPFWVLGVRIWRFILHRTIRTREPDLQFVETTSLRPALDTKRWPGLVVALLLLDDEHSNLNQLKQKIILIMQSQVDKYLVLRRQLCVRKGCYMWKEDNKELDVSSLLYVWQKTANTEAQLQEFVGAVSSKPIATDRPPWKVVLIPYGRSWAALLCAHHLIVDSLPCFTNLFSPSSCNLWTKHTHPLLRGQLATNIVASTLASAAFRIMAYPDGKICIFQPQKIIFSTFTFPRIFINQIRCLAGCNKDGTNYLYNACVEIWESVKLVLFAPYVFALQLCSPVENVPFLRAKISPGKRILAWSQPINRELIRELAEASNTSEVQVLLTACTGAVRRFLLTSNALIPETVSAILPLMIGERKTAAFALVDLPTGEEDSIVRLCFVRELMEAVQKRPLHIFIGAIVLRYASYVLPKPVLTLALNFLSRRHTVSICFVDLPVDIMPHHSRLFYWRPPQGNAGISFTVQMNDDCVSLAVASTQSVLPEDPILTSQFLHEIIEMAEEFDINVDKYLIIS